MEQEIIYYNPEFYLQTENGTKLSKKTLIRALDKIQASGNTIFQDKLILRGDLASIQMGKYVILCESVTIKPSYAKNNKKELRFLPIVIGEYVFIGQNCIICATKIGSNVIIGKNCIIGHRVIINDNCKILDDSIVPSDTVIPPFTVYGGKPANFINELHESASFTHKEFAINYYQNFKPQVPKTNP